MRCASRCASSSLLAASSSARRAVQLGADVAERLVEDLARRHVVRRRVDRHDARRRPRARLPRSGSMRRCARPSVARTRRAARRPRTAGRSRARRRARGTPPAPDRARCARTASRRAGAAPRPCPGAAPRLEQQQHAVVGLGVAEAVDARHRGDDDHVAPLEQRPRRGEAQAVDLLVDRRLLLDVGVGLRGRRPRAGSSRSRRRSTRPRCAGKNPLNSW